MIPNRSELVGNRKERNDGYLLKCKECQKFSQQDFVGQSRFICSDLSVTSIKYDMFRVLLVRESYDSVDSIKKSFPPKMQKIARESILPPARPMCHKCQLSASLLVEILLISPRFMFCDTPSRCNANWSYSQIPRLLQQV